MKLTATTTSTSLLDLIKAYDATNSTTVAKDIYDKQWTNMGFWIEIMRDSSDVNVETILNEASANSRPVNETAPVFAFNIDDLKKVFIYGNWTFFVSIV